MPSTSTRFFMTQLGEYGILINRAAALIVPTNSSPVSLAVYSTVNGSLFVSHGHVDPAWSHVALASGGTSTFISHGYVVAVTRSKVWYSGSIAALPLTSTNNRTWS